MPLIRTAQCLRDCGLFSYIDSRYSRWLIPRVKRPSVTPREKVCTKKIYRPSFPPLHAEARRLRGEHWDGFVRVPPASSLTHSEVAADFLSKPRGSLFWMLSQTERHLWRSGENPGLKSRRETHCKNREFVHGSLDTVRKGAVQQRSQGAVHQSPLQDKIHP